MLIMIMIRTPRRMGRIIIDMIMNEDDYRDHNHRGGLQDHDKDDDYQYHETTVADGKREAIPELQ